MARAPVLAAGGIVLRQASQPLIAVVRLRKRNEWVLPKGKLDDGETARDAAEREVNEETGHDVTVHEFLGTLVYESGGRSKVVHYWRMEADGGQAYELMSDIREVDWLPLDTALDRLSRSYERAFLANVGPLALQAATSNAPRAKAKSPAARKRRSRPAAPVQPPLDVSPPPAPAGVTQDPTGIAATGEPLVEAADAAPSVEPPAPMPVVDPPQPSTVIVQADAAISTETPKAADGCVTERFEQRSKNLTELLRAWLRRAT